MSISRHIYERYLSTREFVNSKSFKNSIVGFLAILLFFGVFNVYANEDTTIAPAWEGTKKFHNKISGTDEDEDNMNSRQGLEVLNTGWTAVSLIAPEITEEGANAMRDESIPYDLRRGLLGMAEDAGNTVYALYPTVDIPRHLAQQWVPGYKESVTSLYAQGGTTVGHPTGYQELVNTGIVGLWNRTLNLSYVFFVLVMIVAGFMIMFRHKIGGQTMVTISSVLPGVILALVLATFSFAIAGLIIDLGGVATGLVAFILGQGTEIHSTSNFIGLMSSVMQGINLGGLIAGTVSALGLGALLKGGAALGLSLFNPGFLAGIAAGALVVGAIGLIILLVILGIIFVGAIKVLITLYKAYFALLLAVILGPIQITLGAIPGNTKMIRNWFLTILRNVLVFPVVLFIINIPNAIAATGADAYIRFPGKLVYEDPGTYAPTEINVAGGVFMFILRIFVLYFAAQAPKYLEAVFPPNSSKEMAEGVGAAKASLQKVPLFGGLFK
jgi:hypothetical protein